jgi:hypothetical protein
LRPAVPVMAAGLAGAIVVAAGIVLSFRGGLFAPAPPARDLVSPAAAPAVTTAPAAPAPAVDPGDDVWRLLARGERASVLARLDASSDATLGRAVVETVRATVLRAREGAAAGARTDIYRNGDEQMSRATRFASNGRLTDALRALWQAGDLYAKTSAAAAPPIQQPGPAPSPAAAATPPAAPPVSEVASPAPPATTNPPPVTPAAPERTAATTAAAPAAVPSETSAVLDALRRYDAAYKAMDVSALLRVFPSLGQREIEQLRRTFEGMSSYEMDTHATRVDVATDTATVQATVARRMSPRVGRPESREVTTEFRLHRTGSEWVIVSVAAR